MIIVDDIQAVFDDVQTNARSVCSPLLAMPMYGQGLANVVFVSSDGSIYAKLRKLSGFTGLLQFFEWKHVPNDKMCRYVTEISTKEIVMPMRMHNRHAYSQKL